MKTEKEPLILANYSKTQRNLYDSVPRNIEGVGIQNIPENIESMRNIPSRRLSWQSCWESWCPLVSVLILLAIVAWLIVSNPNPS